MKTAPSIILLLFIASVSTSLSLSKSCDLHLPLKPIRLSQHQTYSLDLTSLYASHPKALLTIDNQEYSPLEEISRAYAPHLPSFLRTKVPLNDDLSWDLSKPVLFLTHDNVLYWGYFDPQGRIPLPSFSAHINAHEATQCYDMVGVDEDQALVDCTVLVSGTPTDVLYHISLKSRAISVQALPVSSLGVAQDPKERHMEYHSFGEKAFVYRWRQQDDGENGSEVVQVLDVTDPEEVKHVGTIDHEYLRIEELRISGVSASRGDLFVGEDSKIFRVVNYFKGVENPPVKEFDLTEEIPEGSYISRFMMSREVGDKKSTARLLVQTVGESSSQVHNVDWTDIEFPEIEEKYTVNHDSQPDSIYQVLGSSEDFLFVLAQNPVHGSQTLYVFSKTTNEVQDSILITKELGSLNLLALNPFEDTIILSDPKNSLLKLVSIKAPALALNTSSIGEFEAKIVLRSLRDLFADGEGHLPSELLCDSSVKYTVTSKSSSLSSQGRKSSKAAARASKRAARGVSQKEESYLFSDMRGPQGYSPVGFVLFIVSIVYLAIIFVCIVAKVVKSRRRQRIEREEDAGLLAAEQDALMYNGAPNGSINGGGLNGGGLNAGGLEEVPEEENSNSYIALNNDSAMGINASNDTR